MVEELSADETRFSGKMSYSKDGTIATHCYCWEKEHVVSSIIDFPTKLLHANYSLEDVCDSILCGPLGRVDFWKARRTRARVLQLVVKRGSRRVYTFGRCRCSIRVVFAVCRQTTGRAGECSSGLKVPRCGAGQPVRLEQH